MSTNPYMSPQFSSIESPPPPETKPGEYTFYSDPRGLARFVQVMLIICMLMCLVIVISDLVELSLLDRIAFASDEEIFANDIRQLVIAGIYTLVYVVTAIAFLMWVYRMNKNCHHFGAHDMEFTSGWAVGWFFIPIANLWKPYQVMKEIWQVSTDPFSWQVEESSGVVSFWWGVWIVANLVSTFSTQLFSMAPTLPVLKTAAMIGIGADVLILLACVAALILVTKLTDLQLALVWGKKREDWSDHD